MSDIVFTVQGVPQPQGSIRAFLPKGHSKPILTSDNKNLKPWRQDVAWMAKEAMKIAGERMFTRPSPIGLEVNFYFSRPQKAKGMYKTTKPDEDKLLRALLDALTGIVFEDDSQVVDVRAKKLFGETRTEIWLRVLPSANGGE